MIQNPEVELWPAPRRVVRLEGELVLGHLVFDIDPALAELDPAGSIGIGAGRCGTAAPLPEIAGATVVRLRRMAGCAPEGYTLRTGTSGIEIGAADAAGALHGLATLAAIVRSAHAPSRKGRADCLWIEDAPDFAERGVMLDVSRTKAPTVQTLRSIVDGLAALKFNRLQLYMEHTFAYRGHEVVWTAASAYTSDEVRSLDEHCRSLGIELVPNQQSFGHLHRWLVHDRYRPLAEVPEGVEHAFSIHKEPFALCPLDPGALELLAELYDQLLPCFRSRTVNVGLDETFDLGLGRSKAACGARGKHRVYLEFLHAVHGLVGARGRRMQFWGDIVLEAPELVSELPRDAIALEWGYEHGHPFAEHARTFAASGLEFQVCPGTSSWQSVLGRVDNMLANVRSAARAGLDHGARGLLVTDWGDRGHHQPWSVSWPGLLFAAGAAWNVTAAERDDLDLARLLDTHVFRDEAGFLGHALCELGRAGAVSGATSTNGSPLFFLLAFAPQGLPHPRLQGLSIEGLARAREHLERQRSTLTRARPGSADGALVLRELDWGARLLEFACRFGTARIAAQGGASLGECGPARRGQLADELAGLTGEYEPLWHARNRPGGFTESRGWLDRVQQVLSTPASALG